MRATQIISTKNLTSSNNEMTAIIPSEHQNYVAFFLTISCNLKCTYCVNLHNRKSRGNPGRTATLSVEDWIKAANRFVLRDDLPITLQGGEPTLYKGFYKLVNGVKQEIKMDLMTNMMFDAKEFIRNVPVLRFTRKAPYAPIRVSYHPGQNDINDLIRKTIILQDAGFRVGLYAVEHPDEELRTHILNVREQCLKQGLDFRTKEFLGEYNGVLYGTYKYDACVSSQVVRMCECRTTEIIVNQGGYVYKCHSDLYNGRKPIAHILDTDFTESATDEFRHCNHFGNCNPCDVKVKTDRHQIYGHTSVSIRNINL